MAQIGGFENSYKNDYTAFRLTKSSEMQQNGNTREFDLRQLPEIQQKSEKWGFLLCI